MPSTSKRSFEDEDAGEQPSPKKIMVTLPEPEVEEPQMVPVVIELEDDEPHEIEVIDLEPDDIFDFSGFAGSDGEIDRPPRVDSRMSEFQEFARKIRSDLSFLENILSEKIDVNVNYSDFLRLSHLFYSQMKKFQTFVKSECDTQLCLNA